MSLSRIGNGNRWATSRGASLLLRQGSSIHPKLPRTLTSFCEPRSLSTLPQGYPFSPSRTGALRRNDFASPNLTRSFFWSSPKAAPLASTLSAPLVAPIPTDTSVPTETAAPPLESLSAGAPVPPLESVDAVSALDPEAVASAVSEALQHNGDHLGDLAALGLGGWGPSGLIQQALEQFHVGLGIPWWGSIVLLSALMRLALFRIQAKATANNSRIALVSDDIQKLVAEMKDAQARKDTMAMGRVQQKMMGVYAKAGGHPLKGLVPVVIQAPLAICMFFAIRKMCNLPVESMKTGGLYWFTDLTVSDPTYILPVISTGAMLLMLRLSAADSPQTAASGHMRNAFTVMSVAFLPFMAALPNGVFMYFITNGLLLGLQTYLFRLPIIRNWAGIVPPPNPDAKPITTASPLTAQALLSQSKTSPTGSNPTIMESFRALIDTYKKRVNDEFERKVAEDKSRKRAQRDEGRLLPKGGPVKRKA